MPLLHKYWSNDINSEISTFVLAKRNDTTINVGIN